MNVDDENTHHHQSAATTSTQTAAASSTTTTTTATAAQSESSKVDSSTGLPLIQLSLPLSRVKRFVKLDPDVKQMTTNAAKLMARATELFIAYFASKAYERTVLEKRKSLMYQDCVAAIAEHDTLEFLTDVVPAKVVPAKSAAAGAGEPTAKKARKTSNNASTASDATRE
jgi:histone H3/H4